MSQKGQAEKKATHKPVTDGSRALGYRLAVAAVALPTIIIAGTRHHETAV